MLYIVIRGNSYVKQLNGNNFRFTLHSQNSVYLGDIYRNINSHKKIVVSTYTYTYTYTYKYIQHRTHRHMQNADTHIHTHFMNYFETYFFIHLCIKPLYLHKYVSIGRFFQKDQKLSHSVSKSS